MIKSKKLIIVGAGGFGEVALEYFTRDSEYEVVAFAAEEKYIEEDRYHNLPVVAFEKLEEHYDPEHYYVYVALVYTELNRPRARLYEAAKAKGYKLASYVSSKASVWANAKIGEHCFIFEDNTIQPFVEIGNNVILWSGNHIGHHSVVRDNCFISSHVVICGFCDIGENCFFGVNSVVADRVKVAEDCFINCGANVMKNTKPREIHNPAGTEVAGIDSFKLFKVIEQCVGKSNP